mgnify:CR=1 FL=1
MIAAILARAVTVKTRFYKGSIVREFIDAEGFTIYTAEYFPS